tara:strand:- start:4971 stop:6767 length:1797 start_codon:yes stop_codon:yes gene_type:complete
MKKVLWYLNRIRFMSFFEIIHRFKEIAYRQLFKSNFIRKNLSSSFVFINNAKFRDLFVSLPLEKKNKLIERAEGIIEGKFDFLGIDIDLNNYESLEVNDLWFYDFIHNKKHTHQTATNKINYKNRDDICDMKFIWEVHRLYIVQDLSVAYFLTGNEKFLKNATTYVKSWLSNNKVNFGPGWNSGIEISIRSVSLLIFLSLCEKKIEKKLLAKVFNCLEYSRLYLNLFPSLFSSANNHLVAEIVGKLAIESFTDYDQLKTKKLFCDLDNEISKQILCDGVPAEQSPTYGAFTLEFYWLAHHLFGKNISDKNNIANFKNFIFNIRQGSKTASIGDDDEGYVLSINRSTDYAAEICNLFGTEKKKSSIKTFEEGGYSVVHNQGWDIIFDHGPLGYLSICAHGHSDALSLLMSYNHKNVLIDAGTYLYHGGGNIRNKYRSTAMHNTLNINNESQSRISGHFNWSKKANSFLVASKAMEDDWFFVAQQNGYKKKFKVTHERKLSMQNKSIFVEDRFLEDIDVTSNINWLLSPEVIIEKHTDFLILIIEGGQKIKVEFPNSGTININKTYFSPSFNKQVSTTQISWTGQVGSTYISTKFTPIYE